MSAEHCPGNRTWSGFRLVAVAVALLLLAGMSWRLWSGGPAAVLLPPCYFHKVTGLDCPGCGLTRATYSLLHGRFGDAFRLNPLGLALLPLALAGLSLEILAWVKKDAGGPRLRMGPRGTRTIVIVVLAFWLLRNTPLWPWPLP